MSPNPEHQTIAIFIPLIIGGVTTIGSILIHGVSARGMILVIFRALRRGLVGVSFRRDVIVIMGAAMMLLGAHLVEVMLWAVVLMICGEFHSFGPACYHSAMNYTTLGYGDIVMTPRWRFMGPLEALDGMLLIGLSTAALFGVVQRIGRTSQPEIWAEITR
jgi:hypothetical protein